MNKNSVQEIIDTKINPLLKMHNGSCEAIKVEGNNITIKLKGGCAGCPGKKATLTKGIEPILQKELGNDIKIFLSNE